MRESGATRQPDGRGLNEQKQSATHFRRSRQAEAWSRWGSSTCSCRTCSCTCVYRVEASGHTRSDLQERERKSELRHLYWKACDVCVCVARRISQHSEVRGQNPLKLWVCGREWRGSVSTGPPWRTFFLLSVLQHRMSIITHTYTQCFSSDVSQMLDVKNLWPFKKYY